LGCGNFMSGNKDSLIVLWTSGDREVALNMAFMYVYNTKRANWWKEIRLIVWGPSQKLLTEDKELQNEVAKMKEAGVILEACKACSDKYKVTEDLQQIGIDVKYIGKALTEYLKEGRTILTL